MLSESVIGIAEGMKRREKLPLPRATPLAVLPALSPPEKWIPA